MLKSNCNFKITANELITEPINPPLALLHADRFNSFKAFSHPLESPPVFDNLGKTSI